MLKGYFDSERKRNQQEKRELKHKCSAKEGRNRSLKTYGNNVC